MLGRLIASLIAIGLYETALILFTPRLVSVAGELTSDEGLTLRAILDIGTDAQLRPRATIVLVIVLLLIWLGPIKRRLTEGWARPRG